MNEPNPVILLLLGIALTIIWFLLPAESPDPYARSLPGLKLENGVPPLSGILLFLIVLGIIGLAEWLARKSLNTLVS
jgi:uncharacterized membrane protein YkvI